MSPKSSKQEEHARKARRCSRGALQPLLAWGACLVFALSSFCAAGAELERALSGELHPLSMKLKDFDKEWRRVSVRGAQNVSGNVALNVSGTTSQSVAQNNNLVGASGSDRTFLTRGKIISAVGKVWLVAYRVPSSSMDLGTLLQAAATKTPPATQVLTAETSIPLSLLDVEQLGAIEDIQEFNLQREIAESQKAAKALESIMKAEEAKQSTSQRSTNAPNKPAQKQSATPERHE